MFPNVVVIGLPDKVVPLIGKYKIFYYIVSEKGPNFFLKVELYCRITVDGHYCFEWAPGKWKKRL